MILVFSNSTSTYMGGVEIFNEEFESLLENNDIKFFRSKSKSHNKLLNNASRILNSLIFIVKNYREVDFILVQYGNFLDILSLPFLKLSNKSIRVIAHTGDSWRHIENQYLRSLTNLILNAAVKQLYVITDEQRLFLVHSNIKKIHTLINKRYVSKEKFFFSSPYILFLGRICPEKGVSDLIISYAKLCKNLNLPILKIVGPVEDSYREKLKALLIKKNLTSKVFILNPVYEIDDKIELIDNAVLLVYPSYADAFPLTVIESFSRGVCCIATSISETKFFIEFDQFLFTPGDIDELTRKIEYFFSNQTLLQDKVTSMQIKSKKYADGQIINDIFKVRVATYE